MLGRNEHEKNECETDVTLNKYYVTDMPTTTRNFMDMKKH